MRKNADPEPDRAADLEAWEAWNERRWRREQTNLRRRQRRAALRDRFDYPPDPFYALAEQTVLLTVHRPPPLLPWRVQMTLRLRTPGPLYPEFETDSVLGMHTMLKGSPVPYPKYIPLFTAY